MIALVHSETSKLKGSLALLFALVVPALPAFLVAIAVLSRGKAATWSQMLGEFTIPLWALFLFPMAAATFCVLLAQVEYKARSWDHLFLLPFPRWQVYAAKMLVIAAALVTMTMLVPVYVAVAGTLTGLATGNLPSGSIAWDQSFGFAARLLGAAAFLAVVQAWAALRFGNFVVALVVGIGGTLVGLAVAMTGTQDADWFPWVLPMRAVGPGQPDLPVIIGLCGGLAALVAALIDLSRQSRA